MNDVSQSARKYRGIPTATATAVAGVFALSCLVCEGESIIPSTYHQITSRYSSGYVWEGFQRNPYYSLQNELDSNYKKIEIISDFVGKLIGDSEDLNPTYARIVSRRFWDLV